MRILALETSSLYGSVAVADGSRLLAERSLGQGVRTAQALAPTIKELLNELSWSANQLDVIAVTNGPGSFTGLRIGVTTAKTLAYAAGAQVIGIDTLETLALAAAEQVPAGGSIMPLIDAHRNQLFRANYQTEANGTIAAQSEVEIIDIDPWLAGTTPTAWLTGPALRKIGSEIGEHWPHANLLDPAFWTPSAAAVATLAHRKAEAGQFDETFSLLPNYYRPSYAEEKARK